MSEQTHYVCPRCAKTVPYNEPPPSLDATTGDETFHVHACSVNVGNRINKVAPIRIDAYNIQGGYHFADLVDADDEVIASSGDSGQNAYHDKNRARRKARDARREAASLEWSASLAEVVKAEAHRRCIAVAMLAQEHIAEAVSRRIEGK